MECSKQAKSQSRKWVSGVGGKGNEESLLGSFQGGDEYVLELDSGGLTTL